MRTKTQTMSDKQFKRMIRNIFLKHLARLKKQFKVKSMFIVFDGDEKSFRKDLFPNYKANRKEKPKELVFIKAEIYNFLELHNFSFQISEREEADDLIASFIEQNKEEQIQIFSGDTDLATLVGENVTLLLDKQSKIHTITVENFHHFFVAPPNKMNEFKCLQGDKSDSIKGVSGLFSSEVIHLLMEFPTIEDFFEHGKEHHLYPKMVGEKEKILLNKEILTMRTDCEIKVKKEYMSISHIYIPEKLAKKIAW